LLIVVFNSCKRGACLRLMNALMAVFGVFSVIFWADRVQAQDINGNPSFDVADYRVSVGDELLLDFLEDQANAFQLTVGDDGAVQLPYLGSFVLAGEPISQARTLIADAYVENEILITPQIDVSFVKLRPFSVLGDVENPGFFDFRAGLTVETAVGLAGGLVRGPSGEEARASQMLLLLSELDQVDASILRLAVQDERLNAQINGQTAIDLTDLSEITDEEDQELINALVAHDTGIMVAERNQFDAEVGLVSNAIEEISTQIGLTEDQIDAQLVRIASYGDEIEGAEDLTARGLMATSSFAGLLRQVADEETALLRLRTDLAATRRFRLGLLREELNLEYRRMQAWREELADNSVLATQLQATRETILERIELSHQWSERMASTDGGVTIEYTIRRSGDKVAITTLSASEIDSVFPGDVLIVRAVLNSPGREFAGQ